ncbi:DsbA family protein [Thaumasiovibrio subtropicus]|uniref:DsbA family protein n=1 Tax=Thaumasiovibrio subtropicus TaxID=1891207 RepID=UPI000B355FC1|nr:DsbA family protein [Thaumasiovibrio subtropicus]
MTTKLYYFHDPMCSWCWGFKPVWEQVKQALPESVEVVNILGGLAPDSDVRMSTETEGYIRATWKKIEAQLGRPFNHQFWDVCVPKRSTYPACRAVIAASVQGKEEEMIEAIQSAYYLRALSPSELRVLLLLAEELGLDQALFEEHMESDELDALLAEEVAFYQKANVSGFPSLMLVKDQTAFPLLINYEEPRVILNQVEVLL